MAPPWLARVVPLSTPPLRPGGLRSALHPPPRVLGSNVITDPDGEPSLPDQSPFCAWRGSAAARGEIIAYPPATFSANHPGSMNGKESSKVCQRLALWPGLPQEKHTTVFQSRRMGPGRDCRTGAKLPESKFWSDVSNPTDPFAAAGAGRRA